jgi:predicted lipoprotein with Yx(FWY)xxD motif
VYVLGRDVIWKELRVRFGLQSVGLGAAVAIAIAAAVLAVGASAAASGAATVSVRGSDYGNVLAARSGGLVVVYMFAPDRRSKSTCYGTCARSWHPLLTKGRPVAGPGVKANLLGTTTRKDGTVQVTYNGHPLYFDNMTGESNAAGEIGCQHLNVNGGIWLIMKPNGQPNRSKAKTHE